MLDVGMVILQHYLRSVKFSHSVVSDSATPWTAACHAFLSLTNSQNLLKLVSIEGVMPSNHLILCHPLFLLLSIFPSIRIFSNESALPIRWPKYWSFSISPSSEYSGLISFRIGWLDLLVVQGTLRVAEDMSLWTGVYFLWIQVHFLLPLKYRPRSFFLFQSTIGTPKFWG